MSELLLDFCSVLPGNLQGDKLDLFCMGLSTMERKFVGIKIFILRCQR